MLHLEGATVLYIHSLSHRLVAKWNFYLLLEICKTSQISPNIKVHSKDLICSIIYIGRFFRMYIYAVRFL